MSTEERPMCKPSCGTTMDGIGQMFCTQECREAGRPLNPSKSTWLCDCRYMNTGPVCTKCGKVPAPQPEVPAGYKIVGRSGPGPWAPEGTLILEPLLAEPSDNAVPPSLETTCNEMRAELLAIEKRVRQMALGGADGPAVLLGETHAQAVLAIRHLEDARMRLGKVIQHSVGGGVSCFDSGRKPADDGR